MKKHGSFPFSDAYRWLAVLLVPGMVFAQNGRTVRRPPVPRNPQMVRLKISDAYLKTEMESDRETRTFRTSGERFRDNELSIAPTIGLSLDGSIYHPNLLHFHVQAEEGFEWVDKEDERQTGAGRRTTGDESNLLQRLNARFIVLEGKPYGVTLFADKTDQDRDDDFFTRVRVDSLRYGLTAGYSEGPMPFSVTVSRWDEDVDDPTRPTRYQEDAVRFQAVKYRDTGDQTRVRYTYQDFTRDESLREIDDGIRHNLDVVDTQAFDRQDELKLRSHFHLTDLDRDTIDTRNLSLRELLQNQLSGNLDGTYEYAYSAREAGQAENENHHGRIALRHKLFLSLVSVAEVDARFTEETGPESALDTDRYGGKIEERYTKRLQDWGRLRIDLGLGLHREKRADGGTQRSIIDERHVLRDGQVTLLGLPAVDRDSVTVTDRSGVEIFREVLDYDLLDRSGFTEIRRVLGGRIRDGETVLVDYRAQAEPSDSFTEHDRLAGVRLDLFDGLIGFYARIQEIDYQGGDALVLNGRIDRLIGADCQWRFLRAGAEYQDFDADLSPYTATRLFETLTVYPSLSTSLSLHLRQTFTDFPDTNDSRDIFSHILRYRNRLTSSLAFSSEAGAHIEEGRGVGEFDREFYTARAQLDYWIGRTTFRLGYEYEDEDFRNQLREQNLFYVRMKRDL